ncbi:MAG: enoyl-CoA hydratase [Actinomycetota bacterium]|nr:enoyl-CoA hydratase [Actinomycetota bacterium]
MIRFETRGLVGLATIDRQERRNALSGELCDELRTQLDAHRDLRAIVITGAGSAFCAGADLVTRFEPAESASDVPVDSFRPAFELVLDAIVDHPAPVIAAINGPAMGAGMQLAVACDLRVAVRGARMAIPGGRLGVHLSARNIWRLAMLVGQGAARDFLLAGHTVDGEVAFRLGIVQRLSDDPLEAAFAVADEIAASAPLTVRGHKRALNLVAEAQWLAAEARGEIGALEAAAFASADLQEGMAAFAEKRTPDFKGR